MPDKANYSWQRRWVPTTPTADTFQPAYQIDNSGYVSLMQWGPGLTSRLTGYALAELTEEHRCVVLLGEPGIGKSREWHTQQAILGDASRHLFLDLGTIPSEEVLRSEIHSTPAIQEWIQDQSILTLWLDSLDEGLLHVTVLQHALLRVLRSLPVKRLCLRVLCRNAVWPIGFSEALATALDIKNSTSQLAFLTLLLCPLTREQVAAAAQQEQFDPEQFLAAVAAVDAQPLVSRPVTLGLLIRLFRRHQPTFGAAGANTRAGLYQAGCLELCERPDRNRPAASRSDARPRLLLAGYVAMLTVLTNRRLILAEPAAESLIPTELDLYLIGGGRTAVWEGHQAVIDASSLRDLLQNTGLFTDLGQGRLVWAHQSYAEFLAAWYLNLTSLAPPALRPLFRSTADPAGGLVPALRETAGWLADLQPAFWHELLALDPVALIQSDLHRLGAEQRRLLVQRLLEWFATLAHVPYQSSAFASKLCHPGLAQQVQTILTDVNAPGPIVRFAIDLSIACKLKELGPVLVAQASDNTAPYQLRLRALIVLEETAEAADRAALRPLRLAIPAQDEENTFRRRLIDILWPTHLAIDELLPLLRKQKRKRLRITGEFGGLFSSSRTDLPKPTALETQRSLRWFNHQFVKNGRFATDETYLSQAMNLVWKRGWELFDEPDMLPELIRLFRTAYRHHVGLPALGDQLQRLTFFDVLLHHSKRPTFWAVMANHRVNSGEEIVSIKEWDALHQRLRTKLSAPAREWLARILLRLLDHNSSHFTSQEFCARLDQLYSATKFRSVATVLADNQCELPVDDEEDQNWRARHARTEGNNRLARRFRRNWTLHEMLARRRTIQRLLGLGPQLEYELRQKLWRIIGTEKVKNGTSTLYNVPRAAGWSRLTANQKEQAADIACAVLEAHPTPPTEWYLPRPTLTYGARDLYQALLICQHTRPAFLQAQLPAFWQEWTEFLVRQQFWIGDGASLELVQLAVAVAPDAVDQAILLEVQARYTENSDDVFHRFSAWYQALPNAKFPELLLHAIVTGSLVGVGSSYLLTQMLEVGYEPAWAYAEQLIPSAGAAPAVHPVPPHLVNAVYKWLLFPDASQHNGNVDWWYWWEKLATQPATAAGLIGGLMRHHAPHEMRQFAKLTEAQLESLISWLSDTYQLTEADVDDWSEQTQNGRIAAFRTKLATELGSRGSQLAWEGLQRLSDAMGSPVWLRYRIDQVRENLRRNAWEPLQPDALATLSREADRRWVRSAADLQDVLLESLDRFQADLHGELATAEALWMPVSAPRGRSYQTQKVRDENFFSNRLRQHFRQDLERSNLLIKREVETRPSHGTGTGQRPDIYVEAFSRNDANEKIEIETVLIEVKLSRNDETETGLPDQLGDYLADQKYKHGIFLVGWHFGQYDHKPANRLARPELTKLLNEQTAKLAQTHSIKLKILDIRLPGDTGRGLD